MIERRKNNPEQYCPEHDKAYRCRQNNMLICVVHGCDWTASARRDIDKQIQTLPIKKEISVLNTIHAIKNVNNRSVSIGFNIRERILGLLFLNKNIS